MPTFKTLRFDAIALDTEFTLPEQHGEAVLVKKATLSARLRDMAVSKAIPVSAATKVTITIADPTPEELEAKRLNDIAWAEKWFMGRLRRGVEECEGKIARFAERLAVNPTDAFEWGTDTAIAAGRLRAFRTILEMAESEEIGIEKAKSYALRMALQGARNPNHSTAALSNLVIESVTAGYAEIASNSL